MPEQSRLDIVQRIYEALSRTSCPLATAGGDVEEGDRVIGSVPIHLRHLHNLLYELSHEFRDAKRYVEDAEARLDLVRSLFFRALEESVTQPPGTLGIAILPNWDVAALFEEENGEAEEIKRTLAELFGS